MPSDYIFESKLSKYFNDDQDLKERSSKAGQFGREQGIRRLMSINLLKRLESSVYSFDLTLGRVKDVISNTINVINEHQKHNASDKLNIVDLSNSDFDGDDQNQDLFSIGKKLNVELDDMDCVSWKQALQADLEVLENLINKISIITPPVDEKLQTLIEIIKNKVENPINGDNKKIIIFSAFSDTAGEKCAIWVGFDGIDSADLLINLDVLVDGSGISQGRKKGSIRYQVNTSTPYRATVLFKYIPIKNSN